MAVMIRRDFLKGLAAAVALSLVSLVPDMAPEPAAIYADRTVTVGPGRDYSTLQAAEADWPVTMRGTYTIEVYG